MVISLVIVYMNIYKYIYRLYEVNIGFLSNWQYCFLTHDIKIVMVGGKPGEKASVKEIKQWSMPLKFTEFLSLPPEAVNFMKWCSGLWNTQF